MTFDTIWSRISQEVRPGTTVRNWSVVRGYTGGTFQVDDVDRTSVTVSGGNMQMHRRVSKGDFEKVYSISSQYLAGSYPRSKMIDLSQNTTYIVSTLHHLG